MFWGGMATFVNLANWKNHVVFVQKFGFTIPLLMLAFAYLGAVPKKAYGQMFALFELTFLMYFTANISRIIQWIGATHPVVAILLLALSIVILFSSWKLVSKNKT